MLFFVIMAFVVPIFQLRSFHNCLPEFFIHKGIVLYLINLVFNGACLFSTVKKAFSNSLKELLSSLDNLSLNVFLNLKISMFKDL